jgi:hypothetical protein
MRDGARAPCVTAWPGLATWLGSSLLGAKGRRTSGLLQRRLDQENIHVYKMFFGPRLRPWPGWP